MLETIDFDAKLSKEEYDELLKTLSVDLTMLQQQIIGKKIPVVILFDGLSASGKGATIASLILNFDPRGFMVHSTRTPEPAELRKPWMARFAQKMPGYGRIAIFDRSWYSGMFMQGIPQKMSGFDSYIEDINVFERQLADDGYLILKYFLHISKKEQKKRIDKLLSKKSTAWRVSKNDKYNLKNYESVCAAHEELLQKTNSPHAKWNVVSATDKRYVRATVFTSIAQALRERIAQDDAEKPVIESPIINQKFQLNPQQKIEDCNLAATIEEQEYLEKLKELQKKLGELHNVLYKKKIPMIIGYEGNDAAGKGGNIKRVARALDPRGYAVTPIAAPSTLELNHQYLWRFWNALPRTGHIEIFDRTWYGRVLVERVENLTPHNRIMQAYNEINEFEYMLHKWGAIVLKYWIAIDKEEQLKRFELRQNTPEKQWKITDEDWRNRDKWDDYQVAIDDMLKYTDTQHAPWLVVASNNKHYARIATLQSIIKEIEKRI
ncbi:MAG: polyphosphate:AMP phosphotransferase [Christensenellaceae bacterium]